MKTVLIIFGASGNLCKIKLLPAILNIKLYETCEVILYSRNTKKMFLETTVEKVKNKNLKLVQGEYTDNDKLSRLIENKTQITFYLGLPSENHFEVVESLNSLNKKIHIALEKPFFVNLEEIEKVKQLKNLELKFIDHYLLKPLILSFSQYKNKIQPLLEDIDNVRILALEDTLVENRVAFDKDGIFKDMVVTHFFSILEHFFGDGACKGLSFKNLHLRGQYKDYEFKDSQTETFSFSAFEHERGFNVLFVAGKGLKEKKTSIVISGKKGTVTFNIYPNNNVVVDGEVLIDSEFMNKYVKENYVYDDYSLVLFSLMNNKDFYTVPIERVVESYRLLDEINKFKISLFYYEKGIEMPEQVYNFL